MQIAVILQVNVSDGASEALFVSVESRDASYSVIQRQCRPANMPATCDLPGHVTSRHTSVNWPSLSDRGVVETL